MIILLNHFYRFNIGENQFDRKLGKVTSFTIKLLTQNRIQQERKTSDNVINTKLLKKKLATLLLWHHPV